MSQVDEVYPSKSAILRERDIEVSIQFPFLVLILDYWANNDCRELQTECQARWDQRRP